MTAKVYFDKDVEISIPDGAFNEICHKCKKTIYQGEISINDVVANHVLCEKCWRLQ